MHAYHVEATATAFKSGSITFELATTHAQILQDSKIDALEPKEFYIQTNIADT